MGAAPSVTSAAARHGHAAASGQRYILSPETSQARVRQPRNSPITLRHTDQSESLCPQLFQSKKRVMRRVWTSLIDAVLADAFFF